MTSDQKTKKILVVDDDESIRSLFQFKLKKEGYDVVTAANGKEGLEKIFNIKPDLILLDLDMPHMNGDEVCRKTRENVLFAYLPIIILTGSRKIEDKIRLLEFGADDYILKPCDLTDVSARIKSHIKRVERTLDANPLTRIPGNTSIMAEIEKRIKSNKDFSVLYIDLNQFKVYNDRYGFHKGDEIIRYTGIVLIEGIKERGNTEDFIGHIGGDDFVIITTSDTDEPICIYITQKFDENIRNFYDEIDRARGYVVGKTRQGEEKQFPIMSIAIGGVNNRQRTFEHIGKVVTLATEMKQYAKTLGGSRYAIDRRKDERK